MSSSRRRPPGRSRSAPVHDLPGVTGTGNPIASFLLGQVQDFAIDFQQEEIRNRAHFQEYFIQDDWQVSDRVTVNAGLRYTLNFPSTEMNDQVAVFNLETRQLDYRRDGSPSGRSTRTTSVRALASSTVSPTRPSSARDTGSSGSRWRASRPRSRRRCSRSCRQSRSGRWTTSRRRSCWQTAPR